MQLSVDQTHKWALTYDREDGAKGVVFHTFAQKPSAGGHRGRCPHAVREKGSPYPTDAVGAGMSDDLEPLSTNQKCTTTRVVRTDTEHVRVDGVWFRTFDLRDALEDIVRAAGSRNVAFDMPPALYTGSPWADVLLSLGVAPVTAPRDWRAVAVPRLGKVWRSRCPLWETLWPDMVQHGG